MDKLEALKASARGIARLLGDIASFDCWEIDGDIVEIRFEDENGGDTGTDVSITETADKASQAIGELLAALEEKDQRIKELEDSAALDQYRIKTLEALADQNDKQRDHWMERANAAEQRLQQPIKLTQRYETAGYCIDDHYCQEADDGDYLDRDELIASLREQGFKVEGE